jgi:predicted enzyme related to lactoylglutathione lyase
MATETRPKTATHTLVHYEIPAANVDKLCSFYSAVFGWQFQGSPGMETYKMASTTGGEDGVGIAIYPREKEGPPTNYVSVESVAPYADLIEQHGGKVIHRFTVTGMGYGAVALDPEGNAVGLWQFDRSAAE